MLKVVAVATLGLSLIICVGNATAVEMTMPTGDFAHGGGGAGETRDVGANGAMHETSAARDGEADAVTTAHDRMQPDTAADARTDSTHGALGTDTAAGTVHKARRNAHWQSLLPGVMK
jgi:hypothetical protein